MQTSRIVLIEDTRNKVGKHNNIASYCQRHGIELVRECLDVGDYMFPGGKVAIDTKESLDELATNLLNRKDSSRFWREIRRSFAQGTKLIVLCECGGKYKTVNDLQTWRSKYSGVSGIKLIHEIVRCEYAYGTVFKFCDKRSTARLIIELLTEYGSDSKRKDDYAETKTTISDSGGDA